jgi:hypothetical protein
MIEKILDNYYSNKVKQIIKDRFFFYYNYDLKFEETSYNVVVKIKNKKYSENQYETIFVYNKDRALYCLINEQQMFKDIKETIKHYEEENNK